MNTNYDNFQIQKMTLTKPQLVSLIHELGFKPSSSLKKEDLITFYNGALRMRKENIPETPIVKSTQLNPIAVERDSTLSLMEHMARYGWAVSKIPNFDPVEIRNEFLRWLSKTCDRFDPDRPETWIKENMPYNIHGIFKQYIGHTEFIWKTREACIPVFREIWQNDDLLTSFDGGCPGGRVSFRRA